ncbi:MAG: anti-sigma factor domain-containing protein [Acidimicrobiales bacterium]
MAHEDVVELLGAYALDAVDGEERELIEEHLRDCPRCRDEVEQHREVAAHLAFGGEAAPDGLWSRIAAELAASEPEPELGRLYPLRQPQPSQQWVVRGLAAVAAVVIGVLGVLGWQLHSQHGQVVRLQQALGRTGIDRALRDAGVNPNSTRFALTSADSKVHVNVVVAPDGTGFLVSNGSLPALPSDQTYQLWGISGGQPVSLGLLGSKPDVAVFPARDAKLLAMAITVEKAGGVAEPTRTPIAAGSVAPGHTTA